MIKKLLLNQGKWETIEGVPPLTLEKSLGKDLRDYELYGNSFQDGIPTPDTPVEIESVGKLIIPSDYQQVEYIETDGNQYIDTGVLASDYADGISYEFEGSIIANNESKSNDYLFGCLNSGSRSGNVAFVSDMLVLYVGGSSNIIKQIDAPAFNDKFNLKITVSSSMDRNNIVASLNGTNFINTTTMTSIALPDANIYLLGCNLNGNPTSSTSGMLYGKLYSFIMSDINGVLIRKFIPCYRKADNIVGLYDTVGCQFYTNAGTGEFVVGENKESCELPIIVRGKNLFDIEPIETNIYLYEPLRKIGDYADCIDFENKKIIRRIAEVKFDGSESWEAILSQYGINYVYLRLGEYGYVIRNEILCSHFTYAAINSSNLEIGINALNSTGYNDARILVRPGIANITTLELWKEYLAEQYNNGTPVTAYYVLAEPIEEDIELAKLLTLKGTTVLDTNTNLPLSNMSVVYKRR